MAWPAVGVVGVGEASAASQPATGGRSTRHDRRWFGRLEQEDQRLKKHYGRWMEIQRPFRWFPDVRWRNHCFLRNKEAFPCVRPWTQLSASPRKVHFKCISVVDHVDEAAPRAPGRGTTVRPKKGTTRRQGRHGSCFPGGGEYECMRVYWFVC